MENLQAWFKENNFDTVKQGAMRLTDELGISVKEYEEEGLYVFNYSQFASPKTHPVVLECRGLITDNDLKPVCRPFDRFFNMGEALELTEGFNITEAAIFEKADGSLVKMYCHKGLWHVATRGTAFAESQNYTGETFHNLIIEAFGCSDIGDLRKKMCRQSPEFTYILEYTSPKNRVVTPYTHSEMVLLGIRYNPTGQEDKPSLINLVAGDLSAEGLKVRPAKSYKFDCGEDMMEAVQALPGLQEGFVCCHEGKRIKVKSDVYVAVHRLRGDCVPSPKRISELVVTNETEEYLAYFEEDREMFQPYMDSFDQMVKEAHNLYWKVKGIESQKEFAMAVKDKCYFGPLFTARKKDTSFAAEFMNMEVPARVKILMKYIEG